MKLSYASLLALLLNLVTGAPSGLEARDPGNRPINRAKETRGSNQFPSITSLLHGNLLTPKTATEAKYPHKFDHNDSKGNKLAFPDYCPEEDENRQEFPLVSPPPYDGGKNNAKPGDERVVYYWTPGDIDYSDNPNVRYCGIMTHEGVQKGGFRMCS
ncbi:MAG: hypothetical protein Q9210_003633 [Variospora velana]